MLTLNFTPFPVLYTERLCLRRIINEDAQTLFELRINEQYCTWHSQGDVGRALRFFEITFYR